jgi:hypothetical protein
MRGDLVMVNQVDELDGCNAMFKLTNQEQKLVAFLVAVLVVGSAVRRWRDRQPLAPVGPSPVVTPTP